MTGCASSALLHQSDAVEDVVAAVRWIAPWCVAAPTDELYAAALDLVELLPGEVGAIWMWWLGCRRPDLLGEEPFDRWRVLSDDLREVLCWTMQRGPRGMAQYVDAHVYAQPYAKAMRELERAARSYGTLQSCIAALRAGTENLSSVMAQMPGGFDAPALRHGGKGLVMAAVRHRDRARSHGVAPDFPDLRATPRFTRTPESTRTLALDLLDGLPGVDARGLEAEPRPVVLPSSWTLLEYLEWSKRMDAAGLPFAPRRIRPRDSLSLLGVPLTAASVGLPARGLLESFEDMCHERGSAEDWWQEATSSGSPWRDCAELVLRAAYEALLRTGHGALAVGLLEGAEPQLGSFVEKLLQEALGRADAIEVGALTLTRIALRVDRLLTDVEELVRW